ncbi:lipocalin-like domain-containing protein [Dyadobacter crusticola]|uniref:lipocalin family protein n=1 Tax=Dyadobacter crusticola TaxID=292407 RepID=UPI0004E1109A|nr:lipocalin family protein [Dyadobacter crusticola]
MKITHYVTKTLYFVMLALALTVAACKDDKDPEAEPVDDNPIVGTWQLTAITPEPGAPPISNIEQIKALVPCIFEMKLTFNANNTISTADCPIAVTAIGTFVPVGTNAKWKVNGDKLTLTEGNVSEELKITQTPTDLTVVVNTNADATKPPVNALLIFKRV